MSCGEPHETDCRDVLAEVYLYLDTECADDRRKIIRHHLDDCAPCLKAYDLDVVVKTLVARSCTEHAPPVLRDRVLMSIRQVQVHLSIDEQRPHSS